MPQLNPEPWLPILIFTWLIFLTLLPPKILTHTFPNEPTLDTKNIKTEPWHWASLINS